MTPAGYSSCQRIVVADESKASLLMEYLHQTTSCRRIVLSSQPSLDYCPACILVIVFQFQLCSSVQLCGYIFKPPYITIITNKYEATLRVTGWRPWPLYIMIKLVNVGIDLNESGGKKCELTSRQFAQEVEYNGKIFKWLQLFKGFLTKNLAIIIGLSVRFYRR